MKDRILLFIPMYNCENQIVRVLKQIDERVVEFISEVIIVNNRSLDGGETAVIQYMQNHKMPVPCKLLRNDENYGLGGTHKVAFNYAINNGYDYCICLHGDDQGRMRDFIPVLKDGSYKRYDCCLGARFMKGAVLEGYSWIRIAGNYGFNLLFSIIVGKKIYDLGSGLNMYKMQPLKNGYYHKFPDTLYFNDCMILAYCYYKQRIKFIPISWREEDQVSNNKLLKFSAALLKMLFHYIKNKESYMTSEMRDNIRQEYKTVVIYENKVR